MSDDTKKIVASNLTLAYYIAKQTEQLGKPTTPQASALGSFTVSMSVDDIIKTYKSIAKKAL